MSRRPRRESVFSDSSTAPDPLGALGGGEPTPDAPPATEAADPFGALSAPPAPVVESGLGALSNELTHNTTAIPPSAFHELLQQVQGIHLQLQSLGTAADLRTLNDYTVQRSQHLEKLVVDQAKVITGCYKLLGELPTTLTECMGKWFDESLAKFNASGVSAGSAAPSTTGAKPVSAPTATQAVSPPQAEQRSTSFKGENIVAAVLPELRSRKAKNPNFKLSYQSMGPVVWKAVSDFCAQNGVTATPAEVEAAFQASGRLKGGDDIELG